MPLLRKGTPITLEVSAPLVEESLISGFQDEEQIDDRLCWAACIASALRSINVPSEHELSQQQLACRFICIYVNRYDKNYCNWPLPFTEVVNVWRKVGFQGAKVKRLVNLDYGHLISTEIAEQRPVQAYMDGVHAVMVYGYRKRENDEEEVLVMDPQRGVSPRWFTIDEGLEWAALWYALKHHRLPNA